MAPHDRLADIHALEEEMLVFERKYGIRSETFYAASIRSSVSPAMCSRKVRWMKR